MLSWAFIMHFRLVKFPLLYSYFHQPYKQYDSILFYFKLSQILSYSFTRSSHSQPLTVFGVLQQIQVTAMNYHFNIKMNCKNGLSFYFITIHIMLYVFLISYIGHSLLYWNVSKNAATPVAVVLPCHYVWALP